MHYYNVKLKDGTEHYGIIWTQRSREGWFTLVVDDGNSGVEHKIFLRDVESAYSPTDRVGKDPVTGKAILGSDLLKEARQFGWDGT